MPARGGQGKRPGVSCAHERAEDRRRRHGHAAPSLRSGHAASHVGLRRPARGLLLQQPDRGALPLLRPRDVHARRERGSAQRALPARRRRNRGRGRAARASRGPAGGRRTSTSSPPRRARGVSARASTPSSSACSASSPPSSACTSATRAAPARWSRSSRRTTTCARSRGIARWWWRSEICSAAYFLDDRLESAVAHAIFADGAGAIALGADGEGRRSSGTGRSSVRAPVRHGLRVSRRPAARGALQGGAPHRRRP